MASTLEDGDFLVATAPRPRELLPGALVVLEHPTRPGYEIVKRVAGIPGDQPSGGRLLGPDEYWVLGDNARESTDGRSFGPVPGRAIRGVVRFRYWPIGRAGPL